MSDQKQEIEKLQKKCEEYLNGWKRAKADYINYKKEADQRQADIVQFANAGLIGQILPIIENYKKALTDKNITEEQKTGDWFNGLQNINKQFDEFLKNLGIEQIKTLGEKFDPELHEAISKKKHPSAARPELADRSSSGQEKEADIIIEEIKAGYKLQGRVVQVAQVVISE